jgi:RHS repeat-associated protein
MEWDGAWTKRDTVAPKNRFGYNGKEMVEEMDLKLLDYHARHLDPVTGRFLTVDPLAHEFPSWSPYNYCLNNPIRLVDPDGAAPRDPIGPGYYAATMNSRTIGFVLRHPVIAGSIGSVSPGSTNISTNTVRFATRIGLYENAAHEGSQVNAFRHTLWQSTISTNYGEGLAKQIGNVHEENPFVDLSQRSFSGKNALSQADQTIDLLNNQIGRQIGKDNPNASLQELAIKTLDYQYNTGLYTGTTNKNGSVSVGQSKITAEQYKNGLQIINGLNNSGFTAPEQKQRDVEAQKQIDQLNRGPKF